MSESSTPDDAVAVPRRGGARSLAAAGPTNADIVLTLLADLGGAERSVHIEDIAESAWKAAPARFSWPRLQRYPDLDAVDVTLRAAKKDKRLVTGSKRTGWMLTPAGLDLVATHSPHTHAWLRENGYAGRTDNRRERGGVTSSSVRRLTELRDSAAAEKWAAGEVQSISVYDFLSFFNINQYMPTRKYESNRQAIENLVRDQPDLLALTRELDARYGKTYKAQLLGQEA